MCSGLTLFSGNDKIDTMLSPGRVSIDRSSVLKYRNANLVAVVVSSLESSTLSIRLLDIDTGNEVSRIQLPLTVDLASIVGIAMVEDWIVCTYRTTSFDVPTHILVSIYLSQNISAE